METMGHGLTHRGVPLQCLGVTNAIVDAVFENLGGHGTKNELPNGWEHIQLKEFGASFIIHRHRYNLFFRISNKQQYDLP
jgi:hypothetical protein